MRGILENRSPTLPGGAKGASRLSSTGLVVTVICICSAAWLALVLLPSLSQTYTGANEFKEEGGKKDAATVRPKPKADRTTAAPADDDEQPDPTQDPKAKKAAAAKKPAVVADDEEKKADADEEKKADDAFECPKPLTYEPWGYNKNRNLPRWKHLFCEIAKDQQALTSTGFAVGEATKPFTVVDYGADQGFFSISIAKHFPQATVMGVELGGFGGEIWAKDKKSKDVLAVQEGKLADMKVKNMLICQTKVSEKMFFALQEHSMVSRYQLVLSVFHWFNLPTSKDFQKTVVTLFKNAQTTFIELPTIGDRSALIRKQVGWDNWKHWYEGHDNVKDVLEAAASAEGLKVQVKLVAALPWLKWTRDVHRVDVLEEGGAPAQGADLSEWNCLERRNVYGCNKDRTLHQKCPALP